MTKSVSQLKTPVFRKSEIKPFFKVTSLTLLITEPSESGGRPSTEPHTYKKINSMTKNVLRQHFPRNKKQTSSFQVSQVAYSENPNNYREKKDGVSVSMTTNNYFCPETCFHTF